MKEKRKELIRLLKMVIAMKERGIECKKGFFHIRV